jgi:ankyrin repeat protein
MSPLDYALRNATIHGHTKIVEVLVEAGADLRCSIPVVSRLSSVRQGATQVGTAASLVRGGADPYQHVPSDDTALICAARRNLYSVSKYLRKGGVDVNFKSSQYGTALCAALSRSPHCESFDC